MKKTTHTQCIRCGKDRVLSKTWKEKKGDSLLTYSLFVCPDTECQKLVDEKLKKERDRLEAIQTKSIERRKANIKKKKATKKK